MALTVVGALLGLVVLAITFLNTARLHSWNCVHCYSWKFELNARTSVVTISPSLASTRYFGTGHQHEWFSRGESYWLFGFKVGRTSPPAREDGRFLPFEHALRGDLQVAFKNAVDSGELTSAEVVRLFDLPEELTQAALATEEQRELLKKGRTVVARVAEWLVPSSWREVK